MQKFLLFILAFTSFLFKAQQNELTGNTWYLEKLIAANGTETIPPQNSELQYVTATFTSSTMEAKAISTLKGSLFPGDNSLSNETLPYSEWSANFSTNCQFPANCSFEATYFYFFILSGNTGYAITSEGNYLKLTLTASSGGKAVFRNNFLAVSDLTPSNIQIYPNPVKDILNVKYNNSKNTSLVSELFDMQGKKLKPKSFITGQDDLKLDISNLSSGTYVLILKDEKNSVVRSQKIIKK